MGNYFFDFCLKFISFNLVNDAGISPRKFQLINDKTSTQVHNFFHYHPLRIRDMNFFYTDSNTLI